MTIDAEGHENTGGERRASRRNLVVVAVRFAGAAGSGTAETREIGFGGLYLATHEDLSVNSHLKLEFRLGESNVAVDAIVVYNDAGAGVGVRFLNVSEDVQQILKRELPAIETANVSVGKKKR